MLVPISQDLSILVANRKVDCSEQLAWHGYIASNMVMAHRKFSEEGAGLVGDL